MNIKINYYYKQKYLSTSRHKNEREREMCNQINVSIKELSVSDFPIAFIIHDYQSVCDGMKSYDDYDNMKSDFRIFDEEIRAYKGKFYSPVRVTHGSAISTVFENVNYIIRELSRIGGHDYYINSENSFSEKSIVLSDNSKEKKQYIKNVAKSYIYCDGKYWSVCGEPLYVINTFGLGHNHGGTSMFVKYNYNPNISSDNYFSANESREAITWANYVAQRRGDTNDVGKFKPMIEVLIPELVKANPKRQHGKGDSFINSLNEIINNSDSAFEAGLLCMIFTSCGGK